MLVGGNSPVQGFTDAAKATSAVFGDQVMLWMPSANGGNAIPGVNIVRLPNWQANEDPNSYLHVIAPLLNSWLHVPGVIFQLGNEPDLEAGHMGERVQEFADAVHGVAPWAKVGNPPLSVANSDKVRADHCDVVLMHTYYERQHPETRGTTMFGRSYQYGLTLAGTRPVYVTECNVVQTACPIDWSDRNVQLAAWLDQAEGDGVAGVCIFLFDATDQWASFDFGEGAAREVLAHRHGTPITPIDPIKPVDPVTPTNVYSRSYDPRGYRPLDPRWQPFVAVYNPGEASAICAAYDAVCKIIGYDPNAAIAQGCVETNVFRSTRWKNAHAAAGIGIYGDGTPDIIWGQAPHGDVLTGIRAQGELLGDYYCGGSEPWGILAAQKPRLGGMNLGKTKLSDMDGVWASDAEYSTAIVRFLADVLGGAIIVSPTFVTGQQVIDEAMKDLGDDTFIDEGVVVPSYYRCEEAAEVWEERCGLGRLRYADANADADAAPLSTVFPAPIGARVFFKGPGWSLYGHVGHSLGDGRTISALQVVKISDGWQSLAMGCVGWRYAPGVGPADSTPKYRKMRVGTVGDGFTIDEQKRIFFGTPKPSAAQQKKTPWHEGWGVERVYGELMNGIFDYGDQDFTGLSICPGQCLSDEEGDVGTPGRSVRYFTNGKITALKQADGTYTFRWN